MKQKRRKILFWISSAVLIVLITPPLCLAEREMRQQRLDHALVVAVEENKSSDALRLLSAGANPNAFEPLEDARPRSLRDYLGEYLDRLRHRSKPKLEDVYARRPLQIAIEKENPVIVEALLNRGASFSILAPSFAFFSNPVRWAMQSRYLHLIPKLVKSGAKVDVGDGSCDGNTLLHHAAYHGDLAGVRALLDAGADTEVRGGMGWTALYDAILGKHIEIVRLLVQRGANVNAPSSFYSHSTLLDCVKGQPEMIRLLKQTGARNSPSAKKR